ncbi:MAG: hypothetical protein R2793_08180 [Flavobacteriaceae bacterium]
MQKYLLFLLFALFGVLPSMIAQEYTVDIEDKLEGNRLLLYAVNKNLVDLDVSIEVDGTGFKKREGRMIAYRVPATSKVNIMTLIVERGKQALYTYKLNVSDSLSRRVRQVPFERIKIDPKKPITLFIPANCTSKCDSLINPLNESPYKYRTVQVAEDENVKKQLSSALAGGAERLESMDTPIVMLGGKMYVMIESYEDLMARMEEEEQ